MGEGGERLLFSIGLTASISNFFGLEKLPELGQKNSGKGQKSTKQKKIVISFRVFIYCEGEEMKS